MIRFAAALLFATALFADTAEIAYFRGIMLPANETPPLPLAASGNATIIAHIVRNDAGKIISGTVDFNINYAFPGAITLTGLHIHAAPAGVAGSIVLPTDLSGTAPIVNATGVGAIAKPSQVLPTSQAALDALEGMLRDPSQYYVNLHTTDNGGGAMRGQLQRADVTVLMGVMSPSNETPPIADPATGVSQVTVIATRDAAGAFTSGQVIFDINYNFGKQTTISGFHIHNGLAGVAGPVTINTGINGTTASEATAANGAGTMRKTVEVNVANAAQLDTLGGLFTHPRDFYINMHTLEFPNGLIRDQLRTTDLMTFNVNLLPSNETPPIAIAASAPSQVLIRTVRAEDGTVLAGTTTFDVNYRFPAARVEFTGLHVHDGLAGVAGPVRLNSTLSATTSVVSETGFGNLYYFVTNNDANGVATLNSLVQNPEKHYLNLHTTVNGGGVVREQLLPVNNALPNPTSTTSAAKGTTAAVGGLISIFGDNLSKTSDGLNGWQGKTLPTTLNGTKVTIGAKNAPLVYVSPSQINAQVPVDVAAGSQPVVVTNSNGAGPALNATIATVAPAVFAELSNLATGVVQKLNGALVGPSNPARAGDTLVIYATGLGLTTPALATGTLPTGSPANNTATVTVTIGGQNAPVISSVAAPNAVGVYQITVTMPTGVTPGVPAQVVVTMGSSTSTVVRIWAL